MPRKPPKRLFKRDEPGDDDPLPVGRLQTRLHDPELHAEIRAADIIFGRDPKTDKETGPYYGIAAIGRVIRRNESEKLRALYVPVDPATDDVEVLCVLVKAIKGAHCLDGVRVHPPFLPEETS